MKRSGAGLAVICILSTMILVMLGSTAGLYFGAEDVVRTLSAEMSREIAAEARAEFYAPTAASSSSPSSSARCSSSPPS